MPIGAIVPFLPAIGSVIGSLLGKSSQEGANRTNAENVEKQIAFQREQGETQYQRAVADMQAAGLNPALAYKQGGAQAMTGAAAEAKPGLRAENFTAAIEAYNQFANGTAQRQLIREQAHKTMMEANALRPDAILGQNADYIGEYQNTRVAKGRAEKFLAERAEEQYKANLRQTGQTTSTAKAQENYMQSAATLNEQEFMNAWFRKNIAPYINSTSKAMEGVGNIGRAAKGVTGMKPHNRYY